MSLAQRCVGEGWGCSVWPMFEQPFTPGNLGTFGEGRALVTCMSSDRQNRSYNAGACITRNLPHPSANGDSLCSSLASVLAFCRWS